MRFPAKLRRQAGFTLVELLIVVAIIAILAAISIPLVSGSLERARKAADQANERAARATAVIYLLTGNGYEWNNSGGQSLWYDAECGQLVSSFQEVQQITPYGQTKDHEGEIIQVNFVKADNSFTLTWDRVPRSSDP